MSLRARPLGRRLLLGLVCSGALIAALMGATPALAGESAAWWKLSSSSIPTYLAPGTEGTIILTATNLGDANIEGATSHVKVVDTLPPGLTVTSVTPPTCTVGPGQPVCAKKWPGEKTVVPVPKCEHTASTATYTFEETLAPYEQWEMQITVAVSAADGSKPVNVVEVEGGGLVTKKLERPLTVSSEPTPFGIEGFEVTPEDEHGEAEAQAGSHPFQFTTTFALNRIYHEFPSKATLVTAPQLVKNVHVNLPPGFIGNANKQVIPQCTELQFTTVLKNNKSNQCPENTAIGVAISTLTEPDVVRGLTIAEPVYNLVPARGEPARFGFLALNVPVTLDAVDNEGDYHVVVNANNVSEEPAVLGSEVTIWGVPGDPRHDESRGSQCITRGADAVAGEECVLLKNPAPLPFLTLPTSCHEALQSSVQAQSWVFGAEPLKPFAASSTETLEGCPGLPFTPEMTVQPTEHTSNTPSGLKVVLKVPQPSTRSLTARSEASVRNTTVTLPAGVQLSPSAANGLASCSETQIGFEGVNPQTQTFEFKPNPENEETPEAERCPEASKIGTVEVKTPVLEQPLHGGVYLAAQEENPYKSLFGIYIVIEGEHVKGQPPGILVKLAGEVKLDKATGQITSSFPNAPQLPFEELSLELFNGPGASIATPRACVGPYQTQTSFAPWSEGPAVESLLSPGEFAITGGPHGTSCASPQPFGPSLQAGSLISQAGAFTPFTLSLTRPDTDQALAATSITLPPGLAAVVKNVEQCPEAQANAGTCGPGSLIGRATAIAGLGPDPFTVEGGKVYFTEKYAGAPFGLSIVIPTKAGPFDFGNVVTRATINVDRNTTAITINSTLPTMVSTAQHPNTGVPVQLRRVDVTIERPGNQPFQFNPTNCNPLAITGTLTGDQGATSPVSTRFQATGCNKLPFSPTLTAEASSVYTKANGTSLVVKVTSSPGQANIAKTKLVFPEELPSRLTTIQKACPDSVFERNPATCPEGSVIGSAIAHTPLLKNPLTGPAYLVSHGGAAFPDAEFVLQGEGITLILDGQTNISHGITSSTFNTVPDAPVETFEVTLPAGPHSAFTGHGDLCKPVKEVTRRVRVAKRVGHRVIHVFRNVTRTIPDPLVLPTVMGGQNGDVIEKTTPLKLTGCKAVKSYKKKHKSTKHKSKKKKGKKKK